MDKLKSVILKVSMLVLITAVILSGVNVKAFASQAQDKLFQGKVVTRVELGTDIKIPQPIGNTTLVVKTPAGADLDITSPDYSKDGDNYLVPAEQIGIYTITYNNTESGGKRSYSYNVLSYEARDYFVNVLETKDDFIPSFVASWNGNEGKSILLPEAELAYKNRLGNIVSVRPLDLPTPVAGETEEDLEKKEIYAKNADVVVRDGRVYLENIKAGLVTVVYTATYTEDPHNETTKVYRKSFDINAQDGFENDGTPEVFVNSITKTANVGTLYTLPTATVSDFYDSNSFVEISVIGPDGLAVREYKADRNGYAIVNKNEEGKEIDENGDLTVVTVSGQEKSVNPVQFNNDSQRSFYLAMTGDYRVTYTPYNSERAGDSINFTIEVSDKLSPTITSIKEENIPQTWGMTDVRFQDVNSVGTARNGTFFNLPFPEVADNYSNPDNLTVIIAIKNPNGVTTARWNGKVSAYENGLSPESYYDNFDKRFEEGSNLTTDIYKFHKDTGLDFSFNYFDFGKSDETTSNTKTLDGTSSALTSAGSQFGNWTIEYTVRDEAGYGASGNAKKTYTVNVENIFTDIEKPVVNQSEVDVPKHILLSDTNTSFKVPAIGVSDNRSTQRINVEYSISSNATILNGEGSSVEKGTVEIDEVVYDVIKSYQLTGEQSKGGQSWSYLNDGDDWYIIIKNGDYEQLLKIGSEIQLRYKATDHVGNIASPADNATDKAEYYNANNQYFWDIPVFKVSDKSTLSEPTNALRDVPHYEKNKPVDNNELKTGMTLNVGSFSVANIPEDMSEYTGVEIGMVGKDNKQIDVTAWIYYVKDAQSKTTLHVRDITFTPTEEAIHTLYVRFYSIAGDSYAYSRSYDVKSSAGGSQTVGQASVIGSTGKINTAYTLESDFTKTSDTLVDPVIVRKVSGKSFSLMGNTFTGHHASTAYSVANYVYANASISADSFFFADTEKGTVGNNDGKSHESMTITTFSSDESPVIEIHNEMPLYKEIPNNGVITDTQKYAPNEFIKLPAITGYSPTEMSRAEIKVTVTAPNGSDDIAQKLYYTGNGDELVFDSKNPLDSTDEYEFSGFYAFPATKSGNYTVSITATAPSGKSTTASYTIKVGKRTSPIMNVTNVALTASSTDDFILGNISIDLRDDEKYENIDVRVILRGTNNEELYNKTHDYRSYNSTTWQEDIAENTGVTFQSAGNYELIYEAIDKETGNKTTKVYRVTVTSTGTGPSDSMTTLTIVLIILGVILIAGTVVYVVRFKAVKK